MKYTALHNVRHDGKLYKAEEPLELDVTTANTLLACGAIEAVDEAAEATEPEPAKPAPKQKKAKGNK